MAPSQDAGHLRVDDDGALASLVGDLSLRSEDFARLWARHPVKNCVSGVKHLRHPELGELELWFEVLDSPDGSGHRVLMYTAEPGSASEESLRLLSILVGSDAADSDLPVVKRGSTAPPAA